MKAENLTIAELIKTLQEYDPKTLVAFDNSGHAPKQTTTLMSTIGFVSGDYLMLPSPRNQKEYFLEEDIAESERSKFVKVLVLNTTLGKDEI